MSKHQGNPAQQAPQSEPRDLRAEVDALKQSFADLALLLMPHALRNYCGCGKLACRSVQTIKPGVFDTQSFYLCDDCKIPEGHAPCGEVALGPAERETVRLANKLGCLRKP
jgi:hypothetical protein